MSWTIAEHFLQLFALLAIILGSRVMALRAQRERAHREAARLRVALSIGLQALRSLYEGNIGILSGGKPPLISGRNQITLLRTQLGRLTSLEPPEIEAVMTACIAAENVETQMAIAGRKIEGAAFSIPLKDERRAMLMSTLRETCTMLTVAEELLKSAGEKRHEMAKAEPNREPDARDPLRLGTELSDTL